jgi:hypothetical protein
MGQRIAGIPGAEPAHAPLYLGIQVTRHWRGVILGRHPIQTPGGTESMRALEYTLGQEAKNEAASILSRTVSIEQEWFWAAQNSLQHFMREDSK